MKSFTLLLFSILCLTVNAQTEILPAFDKIEGINKTVMNPKLYPLLLKVHISENNTDSFDFRYFVSNLNHFEIFTTEKEEADKVLFDKMNSFVNVNLYKEVKPNTFELITDTHKEYIILKQDSLNAPIVYAFSTKPNYKGINKLKLM